MNTKPDRGKSIINYIKQHQEQAGYPPTITEIGVALGLGKSTVHYHLKKLILAGQCERQASSARTIKVL